MKLSGAMFAGLLALMLIESGPQALARQSVKSPTPADAKTPPSTATPNATTTTTTTPPSTPSRESAKPIRFKPPTGVGAASNVVAGGTRGMARELVLFVAAPNQLGLTAAAQPDLYWYVSRPLTLAPEFTLVEAVGTQALVERKLPLPSSAGFQRIVLKDMGVELVPGKEYVWQVSLSTGAAGAGSMIDASGRIRRMALSNELAMRVQGGSALDAAAAFADAGYWYDAVMRLRDAAGRSPGFSEPEVSLFDSAGLGHLIRRATDGTP